MCVRRKYTVYIILLEEKKLKLRKKGITTEVTRSSFYL